MRTARVIIRKGKEPGRVESLHVNTSMTDAQWAHYLRQMVDVMARDRFPGAAIAKVANDCYAIELPEREAA